MVDLRYTDNNIVSLVDFLSRPSLELSPLNPLVTDENIFLFLFIFVYYFIGIGAWAAACLYGLRPPRHRCLHFA